MKQQKIPQAKLGIKHIYKFGEVIGKGSFGTVRRAVKRDSGEEVAIKTIQK